MSLPTKFEVKFIEKELVEVKLNCIDLLQPGSIANITEFNINNPVEGQVLVYTDGKWVNTTHSAIISHYHVIEEPTKLTARRFRTSVPFIEEDLQVTFNGLVENNLIIHSNTEFSFGLDILESDEIRANYIRE